MKLVQRLAAALILVAIAGCTQFSGVKPVYPSVGNPHSPPVVDSLQPTLSWEPMRGVTSYDLIIYQGVKTESFARGTKRSVGPEVYYRQGLTGTSHKVEITLKPSQEYYWSVRGRDGNKVTRWSLYDYSLLLGLGYVSFHNQPFLFVTPAAPPAQQ